MPFTVTDILLGCALPALVGAMIYALTWYMLPVEVARRWAASAGLVSGFLVGYRALSLGPWLPAAHWHWLPAMLVLAGVVGPISRAKGVTRPEALLVVLLATALGAYVLVPQWDDLQPSRPVQMVAWTIVIASLTELLEPLSSRIEPAFLPCLLTLIAASAAVLLALSGSLRFAQIAGAGTGALAGLTFATWLRGHESEVVGLAFPYAIFLGGALLIGRVNSFSSVPLASYLLILLAPVSLWAAAVSPLSQWIGVRGLLARAACPAVLCALGVLLALATDLANSHRY